MWSRGPAGRPRCARARRRPGAKFADYFDFAEPFTKLPSHRILALFRGEKEEVLDLDHGARAGEADRRPARAGTSGASPPRFGIADRGRPADRWLLDTVRWAWRTRILVHLGVDLRMRLWQAAEDEAVRVFAANLRDLLLAAPAGTRATMGLDPGFRTGVKVAVVDAHRQGGRHRHDLPARAAPNSGTSRSPRWPRLAEAHAVELIAIGNGTASRETDKLAAELIKRAPGAEADQGGGLRGRRVGLLRLRVRLAGAARLDVSLRGAVSIARRLQDPLAELVKIDPKSIGVGQYQHDLSEVEAVPLARRGGRGLRERGRRRRQHRLGAAADPGLRHRRRAGREHRGAPRRQRPVPHPHGAEGGAAARARRRSSSAPGFLRIPGGDDPLDASSVHPEAYPVVRRILDRDRQRRARR